MTNSVSQSPKNSIVLDTYAKLDSFVDAFASGHINLLILVGNHGLAKSSTVRNRLGGEAGWIEGNASAFGMYLKLFEYRDQFIVIDDVDALYSDRHAIRLLKCLCQTEPEKTVAWPTAARDLKKECVPREFKTSSRVVIISNDWKTLNRNVAAVEDRGHTLFFQPTAQEVHEKTAEWFDDGEIYDWFGENLHRVFEPSMRLYYRARELKRAGIEWRSLTPLRAENRRERLVWELSRDDSFATQEARVGEFRARGGGCRATYFNYLRMLGKRSPVT